MRVLDVGGGPNPAPGATVVLDLYRDETPHSRLRRIVRVDVVADAHHLPFKDKAFDIVVGRHVLEHLENPIRALREMERVGRAVIIEVPHPLAELILRMLRKVGLSKGPNPYHRWRLGARFFRRRGYRVFVGWRKLKVLPRGRGAPMPWVLTAVRTVGV